MGKLVELECLLHKCQVDPTKVFQVFEENGWTTALVPEDEQVKSLEVRESVDEVLHKLRNVEEGYKKKRST